MIEFRDYQENIISEGTAILKSKRFLYLAMEVRTGKTLTSLGIADNLTEGNVLFVTKKKAISSIENDYKLLKPNYELHVINYESLHKIPEQKWDLIVFDEAHSMGAFPKPSNRAKGAKALVQKHQPFVIMLSGTPTPESYSQMYHQVFGIPGNPFASYKNFYRFADDYVKVTQRRINGFMLNDYSNGLFTIIEKMAPYTISYTQQEAGFKAKIHEEILYVDLKQSTYDLIRKLSADLVIEGNEEVLMAETGVKMMSKLHQLYSGTVKFESGNSMIVDYTKAEFIRKRFKDSKIGIFYKFKEEYNAIKEVFGSDVCDNLDDFDNGDCQAIALQIVSGREGISLRNADFIVFYNIDFSATSYWQARDRMTTKNRLENKVYWIFSRNGIENDVYKAVVKKKDYTLKHFKDDRTTDSKEADRPARVSRVLRTKTGKNK